MKIVAANSSIPDMIKEEAERFLRGKPNLQFATIDEKGDPNIQPVWFYYDKDQGKLLIIAPKLSRKRKMSGIGLLFIFLLMMKILNTKGSRVKGNATIVEDGLGPMK